MRIPLYLHHKGDPMGRHVQRFKVLIVLHDVPVARRTRFTCHYIKRVAGEHQDACSCWSEHRLDQRGLAIWLLYLSHVFVLCFALAITFVSVTFTNQNVYRVLVSGFFLILD